MSAERESLFAVERWRVGRKVGRTIYAQLGAEPSDDDRLIGLMDTPELATKAVRALVERDTFKAAAKAHAADAARLREALDLIATSDSSQAPVIARAALSGASVNT